jgi:hypothetical protein
MYSPNEEFARKALTIKTKHPIAWNALNLDKYSGKSIKDIENEISKFLSKPLLDDFTNIDSIYLQESTIVANMLLMPNVNINYIMASIFQDKFNCAADIAYIEDSIIKKQELITLFENKMVRLLELTRELDTILSVQCPKYKNQASIIIQFIDEEFNDFLYLDNDVQNYLSIIKSRIKSGIVYINTTIKRYNFRKTSLPIDKKIDRYYEDQYLQIVHSLCNKITDINIMLNQREIQTEDIIYLLNTNSIKDNLMDYLHRMQSFITQWYNKDIDCVLYKFYKNKSIVLSTDLFKYRDFLIKHIINIDIYDYWDTYFRDIEFYHMAIILIANKIHYNNLCKKYKIAPYEDEGISFLLESFDDGSFNIFSEEIESDIAILGL